MRKQFAEFLHKEMSCNSEIVILTGDLGYGLWDKIKTDAQYLNIEQQTCIRLAKLKIPIFEIEGREPKRIGGERKMRPLTTGAQLSYQIIKEFIYWKL